MAKTIWTPTARALLFEQLVKRYGAYSEWHPSGRPGRDLDTDFDQFCELFAQVVGANSADAVKLQIRYGTGQVRDIDRSRAMTLMRSMVAAYDAGFVRHGDFPALRVVDQEGGITNWPPEPHHISEPERWAELQAAAGEPADD